MSNRTWRRWIEGLAVLLIVTGTIQSIAGNWPQATYDMSAACAFLLATMTIFKDEEPQP